MARLLFSCLLYKRSSFSDSCTYDCSFSNIQYFTYSSLMILWSAVTKCYDFIIQWNCHKQFFFLYILSLVFVSQNIYYSKKITAIKKTVTCYLMPSPYSQPVERIFFHFCFLSLDFSCLFGVVGRKKPRAPHPCTSLMLTSVLLLYRYNVKVGLSLVTILLLCGKWMKLKLVLRQKLHARGNAALCWGLGEKSEK